MSKVFGGKEEKGGVDVVADPYQEVREPLIKWLKGTIGKSAPAYGGQLVAPMSEQEEKSLGFLDQYAERQPSSTFSSGKKHIEDTLGGKYYDPTKSPYYQAVKAEAAQLKKEGLEDIAGEAASGGRYWTGARLGEQGEFVGDVTRGLQTTLGQFAENLQEAERNRQMQAVPLAYQYGQYEEEAPLRTTAALQEFGSLPRLIQQALDDALYQEFVGAEREWPLAIGQLAAGIQQAPLYQEKGYSQSPFTGFLTNLGSTLGGKVGEGLAGKIFTKK